MWVGKGSDVVGRGGKEGRGGLYCIHDNIHSILLGRGSNVKTAHVLLGRSSEPPRWGVGGWAGALGVATISVTCGWAGAVMRKLLVKAKVLWTDGPT